VSSGKGFWLNVSGEEFFLAFNEHPWFRDASTQQLFDVTLPSPGHLHWPSLDVDLEVESLRRPQDYPLSYRAAKPARARRLAVRKPRAKAVA
jgi:hypothetical protein